MSKQFETKEAFDKWVIDFKNACMKKHGDSLIDWLMAPEPSLEDYISGLVAEGYTDLDNLIKDGHRYEIAGHTNNGWLYRDEADMDYINANGISVEIRERM